MAVTSIHIEKIDRGTNINKEIFEDILLEGSKNNASEVELTTDLPILAARNQQYGFISQRELSGKEIISLLNQVYGPEASTKISNGTPFDFSHEIGRGQNTTRFRINVTPSRKKNRSGVDVSCRLLDSVPPKLKSIQLTEEIYELYNAECGINIIAGPTGSGKTTTQAAFRRRMIEGNQDYSHNSTRFNKRKIIEYGSPIEFVFEKIEWKEAFLIQSEIGRDVPDFAEAARNAMRRFAQVIDFTETRDPETAIQIPNIGATGHLFSTSFHGSSVGEALGRFTLLFPNSDRDAASHALLSELNLLICQRLVKKVGGGVIALREIVKLDDPIKRDIRRKPIERWADTLNHITKEMKSDFRSVAINMIENGFIQEEVLDNVR